MKRFKNPLAILFILLFLNSCTKDKIIDPEINCTTNVTYNADIKSIIDKSCAYSSCHVSGFSNGNYLTYSTLKGALTNGQFEKWVIRDRLMPPPDAPLGKPTALSNKELELIKCWKENSYAEK